MSDINYSKLKSLTAIEITKALCKDGFYEHRQRGSHKQFRHEDGRRVTVSFHHSGDTFSTYILKLIIEDQAEWTRDDLIRLKLLKE